MTGATQSLVAGGAAVHVAVCLCRDPGGELFAAVDIMAQAPLGAPGGELVGPQVCSDHEMALPAQLAFALLGGDPPFGIGAMQAVSVQHHGLDAREVLELVPGHAKGGELRHVGLQGGVRERTACPPAGAEAGGS